jgi:hypothetical protein
MNALSRPASEAIAILHGIEDAAQRIRVDVYGACVTPPTPSPWDYDQPAVIHFAFGTALSRACV